MTKIENWALVVMLVAGTVLLVDHVVEQDWIRTTILAIGVVVVGGTLVRRRRASS